MVRRETFASPDRLDGSCAAAIPGRNASTRIVNATARIQSVLKEAVYLEESAINDIFRRKNGLNRTQRAACAIDALDAASQRRSTELVHVNPYELIVATVLSAQCTDDRVNQISPSLFSAYPTVQKMAQASPEEIFLFIKSVTYPNSKSRHLAGLARMIVHDFGGRVPGSVKELKKLPGVGQKTAQVVAAEAFDIPTLAVDTHVFRVSHRLGLVNSTSTTPEKVERQLKRLVPKEQWSNLHHILIFHGRYVCKARSPECKDCPVSSYCAYYEKLQQLPEPLLNLEAFKGKFYCATRRHYFGEADLVTDRYGVEQVCCPRCGSMNVFVSKSGVTTKRIKDFRV
ncbi:MAG: endonuclease III [Bacteroidetes bacterium]|nr:endonuclease III [Bacteroidota bacterium]